jgi:hypothetical protein
MWLRSFGVLSAAVLFTNGIAFGQDAVIASGGGGGAPAYGWLSPAPLAWTPVNFNWADLPIKLNAHESAGYNSNIYNLIPGTFKLPPGQVLGDYFIQTTYGASAKANVQAQQFFADISFFTTNYRQDHNADQHNHSFDGGVNWAGGSLCAGQLKAVDSLITTPQQQAIGPGIDNVTTESLAESGQCHFYQDINVIFNADAISSRHSLVTAQLLDSNAYDMQGGIQYAWASLDNIEALVKFSKTRYTNYVAISTIYQTPQDVNLVSYTLTYNYTIAPLLNVSAMGGFTESLGLSSPGSVATKNGPLSPIYSFTLNYLPTSKWTLSFVSSRTVSAPNSIIASATQVSTTQSLTASYAWTPKFTLQASYGLTTTSAPGSTVPSPIYNAYLYGANTLWSSSLNATYQMTPFTSLVFALQNSNRQTNGTRLNTSIVTMGLDYRPQ